MLGRKIAEQLASIKWNIKQAKAYGSSTYTFEAQEGEPYEDTENKYWARDIKTTLEVEDDNITHCDFLDEDGNLVWREPINKHLQGKYELTISITYPYEEG